MPSTNESDQPALEVGVQVDIGLVENDGRIVSRASHEPHGLEPHLQPMAHERDLSNERAISHQEPQETVRVGGLTLDDQLVQREPGPRLATDLCEGVVVVPYVEQLVAEMGWGQRRREVAADRLL